MYKYSTRYSDVIFNVRKLFKHGKAWKNKFLSYTFSKQES